MTSRSLNFDEDIMCIAESIYVPWNELNQKTILVTGATGLIGRSLIKGILLAGRLKGYDISIIALVRNAEKAKVIFSQELDDDRLDLIEGFIENLPHIDEKIDYIIHGASITSSSDFVNRPVETINTAVKGTENILQFALNKKCKGIIYLSSMEVYGNPTTRKDANEQEIGAFVPANERNSYPISKLTCEALVHAYYSEYALPAKVIRLTQTFGAGVDPEDNRVFAYFARCAKRKEDIILNTLGETERSYLYTSDAVTAILTVLIKGENGETYNAANEETYCSIREMAEAVAEESGIKVRYEIKDVAELGYAKTLRLNLDTSKIRSLGWQPTSENIKWMLRRVIDDLSE